jgi:mRNA interferase RelE/StbE
MRKIDLTKQVQKFLGKLPPKQRRQVSGKIFQLAENPIPPDSKLLKGFPFRRADIGEYRIVYRFDEETLFVPTVGKRNDDDVYRLLRRLS